MADREPEQRASRRLGGWVVAGAWALTLVLAWWGAGGYLGIVVEGNDRSLIPTIARELGEAIDEAGLHRNRTQEPRDVQL